jgi:hypothetical protein
MAPSEQTAPDGGVAIFLCDSAHAHFALGAGHPSILATQFVALTADAHGTALRLGASRVMPPYAFADYPGSLLDDFERSKTLGKNWLGELDLSVVIEGINLAELDQLNQFLFFQFASYIARTAEAMIDLLPETTIFHVPVGETYLPADYYLDSDIAAAILLFLCEKKGRTVVPVVMADRPLRFGAKSNVRPFVAEGVNASVFRQASDDGVPGRRRVGFMPAVVSAYADYYEALSESNHEILIFSSAWMEKPHGPATEDLPVDANWLASVETLLGQYHAAFRQRLSRSSLPDFIVANEHLAVQFEYILTTRWLAYAKYIHSAVNFVGRNPLDLFIYCEHFIAEGAILAALYRRSGSKIAVTTHSVHACEIPFVAWDARDTAIVQSTYAARQALRRGGLQAAYVAPRPRPANVALLSHRDGPKRLLFLTNAVEVQYPLIDIRTYLRTVRLLGEIPAHLAGKVELLVRLKPGIFTEHPKIYAQLCGLSEESLTALNGLSLTECIEAADCVIGLDIPTTAYLEVMALGKPLIYAETAAVFKSFGEGFPFEIGGVILRDEDIWPEIERVLFDRAYRARILARQADYIDRDRASCFPHAAEPIRAAIDCLLSSRGD